MESGLNLFNQDPKYEVMNLEPFPMYQLRYNMYFIN